MKDAKGPPSTAQADQFKAAFQTHLNSMNDALLYTAINAEPSKHEQLAGKRDNLMSAYQLVLGKIDPNDASTAKASIEKTLGAAKSLAHEITSFKKKVEAAIAAWQSKEPSYEAGVSQVEELEAWEDPQAAAMRTAATAIRDLVNKKAFGKLSRVVTSC